MVPGGNPTPPPPPPTYHCTSEGRTAGSECKTKISGDTFDLTDPQFYPGVYVALITLLTYYTVSTSTAKRSFSV